MYASIEILKLKQNMLDTINSSELPFCVMQYVLTEISNAVNEMAKKEHEIDLMKMEESKKEEETSQEEPEG